MNEGLPKLVVERLRMAAPEEHPDADLLAAFSERTLPPGERDGVLRHLAACSLCREVIALATPEQHALKKDVPATSGSWLTWPYLRWGAALACVVVVGAAVTLRREHAESTAISEVRKVEPSPASSQYAELRNEARASESADRDANQILQKSLKKASPAGKLKPGAPPQPSLESKDQQLVVQGRNYDALNQSALTKSRADEAPARAKEQNEVIPPAAAPTISDKSAELDQREYLKLPNKNDSPTRNAENAVVVESESAAVQTETVAVQATGGPQPTKARKAGRAGNMAAAAGGSVGQIAGSRGPSQQPSLVSQLGARWTLSPEGALQRSLDSGATWQTVSVAPNLSLRAVSASGTDVWVGGAGGALFHSSDNGEHWTQVRPESQGKLLTGDIVGLVFNDLAHGHLTTTYETWATSDGGKTWTRIAR